MNLSLEGLNKADVLAALYNAAAPKGMGFLNYDRTPMTREEAQAVLDSWAAVDYLKGRCLKVDLRGADLDPARFDREYGEGAAERILASLRHSEDVHSTLIQAHHDVAKEEAALIVRTHLQDQNTVSDQGGVHVLSFGLADVADELGPAVDKTLKE